MHHYRRFAKIEPWKSLLLTAPVFGFASCGLVGCGSTTQPATSANVAANTALTPTVENASRTPAGLAASTRKESLTPQPSEKQIAALTRVQKLAAQWAAAKIASLPQNNDFGILICEPGTSGGEDVAHFGAGIARWLQFHVGGQGELGKTPAWNEVEIARRTLQKPNLQFSTIDATQLPSLLGITHTVTGRIDRASNVYILSLQLWKLEKRNANWETVPVGNVLELRGARDQLLQQLPKTARQFSQQLGIASPEIPPRVELNADEIQFLGSLSWNGEQRATSTQQKVNWQNLASKSALAAAMKVSSGDAELKSQLLLLVPRNAVALNLTQQPSDKLQKLRNEFPRNALICEAKERAQNAPQNPHAWLQIETPKREAFFAALQATRTAPKFAMAWREVSRRARILNENDVAELALWKALRLDGTDEATYLWGAQLLGKSGLQDAAQFQHLEKLALRKKMRNANITAKFAANRPIEKVVTTPDNTAVSLPVKTVDATTAILPVTSTASLRKDIEREEANLRRNERDGKIRARLAKLYEQNGDAEKARGALTGWIAIEPRNVKPLLQMAQLELRFNNRDAAQKVLQRARRIAPQNAEVRQLIGILPKAPAQSNNQ